METQQKEDLINQVKQRYDLMVTHLSEKDKRLWAASEADTIERWRHYCLSGNGYFTSDHRKREKGTYG